MMHNSSWEIFGCLIFNQNNILHKHPRATESPHTFPKYATWPQIREGGMLPKHLIWLATFLIANNQTGNLQLSSFLINTLLEDF